ncbi:MAG: hypothetical protein JNN30_21955 [Rhodanobacteraceae bacterium]|nr:hypothetical protein [Rhodanobacteraceae bacterium]
MSLELRTSIFKNKLIKSGFVQIQLVNIDAGRIPLQTDKIPRVLATGRLASRLNIGPHAGEPALQLCVSTDFATSVRS